jgi:hypothetical protein
MESDVPIEALAKLLDELAVDPGDEEHADVAVADEDGLTLSISSESEGRYRLVCEDVEDSDATPRHMAGVERSEALRIMSLVAEGRLEDVDALSWISGY